MLSCFFFQEQDMSPRLVFHFPSSSVLAVVALAGCSDPAPPARFADATPAQLKRAYAAATGHELIETFVFLGLPFSGRNEPTSCPSIVTNGQDTTVTFDCTVMEGGRMDGSIELHNVPADRRNPAYDPSKPSTMRIELGATDPEAGNFGVHGRVEFSQAGISGDLTLNERAITSISRVT